jgi:hypothetical protein
MKNLGILLILCFVSIYTYSQTTFSVVDNESRTDQIYSMVWKQWSFTPEWYYYDIFNGGLLGLHQGYTDIDRRNIYQLTPTTATSTVENSEWKDAQKSQEKTYNMQMTQTLDREVDAEYILMKSSFDDLENKYKAVDKKLIQVCSNVSVIESFRKSFDNIKFEIALVQNSTAENAKKRESYLKSEKELELLVAVGAYTIKKFQTIEKLKKMLNVDFEYTDK